MYNSALQLLSNGLAFIHTDISHIHLSSVYAFVRTGSLYEKESERGYAHLLEHLLLKRLTTHRTEALTKFCTSRGMYFNAETGREHTLFYIVDIMPEYLGEALEFMNQILFHPVFTEADMEEEKKIVISELKDRMSSPHYKMQKAFSSYYFGDHPLGREIGGNVEEVQKAEFSKLMDFYHTHYTPNNIILSTAGPKAGNNKILSIVDRSFAKEPMRAQFIASFPIHVPPKDKNFMYLLDFAESVNLEYYFTIPGRNDYTEEERFAFYLYEEILGGSRYSRLFLKLREENHLVYDVSTSTSYVLNTGSFSIDTSCTKEAMDEIATLTSMVLKEMRDTPVTAEELEEAKTNALLGYYQILDDVNKIASRAGNTYLRRGIIQQPETSLTQYRAVTTEAILEIGKKYLQPQDAYSFVSYKEELTIPRLT